MDGWVLVVDIASLIKRLLSRQCEVRGERIRERQRRLPVGDGLRISAVVGRMNAPGRADKRAQRTLDVASVATADYRLPVREGPPGEADARTEIGLLRKAQTLGNARLRRCQDRRRSDAIGKPLVQDLERFL